MNRAVRFDDIRALLVSHIDNAGISRVKVLPHRRLLSASTHGVTISNSAGFLFSVDDHLNSTPALDPVVERRRMEYEALMRDTSLVDRIWRPARAPDGPPVDWAVDWAVDRAHAGGAA